MTERTFCKFCKKDIQKGNCQCSCQKCARQGLLTDQGQCTCPCPKCSSTAKPCNCCQTCSEPHCICCRKCQKPNCGICCQRCTKSNELCDCCQTCQSIKEDCQKTPQCAGSQAREPTSGLTEPPATPSQAEAQEETSPTSTDVVQTPERSQQKSPEKQKTPKVSMKSILNHKRNHPSRQIGGPV